MVTAPTVSVVLPTYNRAALLPVAMASVLAQSFRDLELIVVDDGSDDGTEGVVESFRSDPRVVYLRRPVNGGVSAARNSGIGVARGRLIAFQDSDDEWVQEKLRLQVDSLNGRSPDCFSVGTVMRRLDGHVRKWPARVDPDDPDWACAEAVAYCQALLVPRDLLVEVGSFDESLGLWEDWDLLLRLLQRGTPVSCEQAWAVSTRQSDSLTQVRSAYAVNQGRVIDRHRALLSTDPRRLAQLEYVTARYALENGQRAEAVRRLRNCLAARPGHLRAAAFFVLAAGRRVLPGRQ